MGESNDEEGRRKRGEEDKGGKERRVGDREVEKHGDRIGFINIEKVYQM